MKTATEDAKAFNDLCATFLLRKQEEEDAKKKRLIVQEALLAYFPDKLPAGTSHAKSLMYDCIAVVKSEATAKEKDGFAKLWAQLPVEVRQFVLIPEYKFSKSAYANVLKQLKFLAVSAPRSKQAMEQLIKAVEEQVVFEESSPSFTVLRA